jgi:hypothetical protein
MCQATNPEDAKNPPDAIAGADPETRRRLMEARLVDAGITESDLMAAGYRKSDLLQFLATPPGEKLVDRILGVLESFKGKDHNKDLIEMATKVVASLVVVGVTALLVGLGTFDPSVGVLFGAILGYIFANKKQD